MQHIIERRDMGYYPISIGTSLALETLTRPKDSDPDRKIPDIPVGLDSFGCLAINLNTLCRTMIGSMRTDALELPITKSTGKELYDNVMQEVNIIRSIVEKDIPVRVYLCTYDNLERFDKKFHFRRVRTGKALHYDRLLTKFLEVSRREPIDIIYKGFTDLRNLSLGQKILVHTSHPYDIINNERASLILEPHTGEVLARNLFYKKLYKLPKLDMSMIPLNKVTYLLFGDKHLISPIPIKLRKEILKISITQGWMYNTPMSRMVGDILSSGSNELKTFTNAFRR